MNTITINNKINKVAKKFNIKIDTIEINLIPSWNYGEDSTNNEFDVKISIVDPEKVSEKRVKNFIGYAEAFCTKAWKYDTTIEIINKEY